MRPGVAGRASELQPVPTHMADSLCTRLQPAESVCQDGPYHSESHRRGVPVSCSASSPDTRLPQSLMACRGDLRINGTLFGLNPMISVVT